MKPIFTLVSAVLLLAASMAGCNNYPCKPACNRPGFQNALNVYPESYL
jgi:hypothetical protein